VVVVAVAVALLDFTVVAVVQADYYKDLLI